MKFDEEELYTPVFFKKEVTIDPTGKKDYRYYPLGNKYWDDRESG